MKLGKPLIMSIFLQNIIRKSVLHKLRGVTQAHTHTQHGDIMSADFPPRYESRPQKTGYLKMSL